MKFSEDVTFWAGVFAVYFIALAAIFTGTHYVTHLPLGTLTQYSAVTQPQ